MVIIVSSVREPTFQYYDNLAFLRNGIQNDEINFQGFVDNHAPPAFVFNIGRIYDFTRSARAKVRDTMANYLCNLPHMPGLTKEDCREAFDCLFDYYTYKGYLTVVGQHKAESMRMLIFDDVDHEYVAHVQFSSNTRRNAVNQFTVNATLTCQRYTYFDVQETDFDEILRALQNLHVDDSDDSDK